MTNQSLSAEEEMTSSSWPNVVKVAWEVHQKSTGQTWTKTSKKSIFLEFGRITCNDHEKSIQISTNMHSIALVYSNLWNGLRFQEFWPKKNTLWMAKPKIFGNGRVTNFVNTDVKAIKKKVYSQKLLSKKLSAVHFFKFIFNF